MASQTTRRDLKALHNLINQADLVLATIPRPHASVASARESLSAALRLSNDVLARSARTVEINPAAALGARGGLETAKRGSEYFRQLAAKRKKHAGGRPPTGT